MLRPLLGFLLQRPQTPRIVSRTQPTNRARITLDLMLGNQIKHQPTGLTGKPDHPLPHLGSKARNGVIWRLNQTRIDLPTVAP